jgi:hypothetical protein
MNTQHLIISYLDTFPVESFERFRLDAETPGLKLISEARPQQVFAGIEWLLPTAVVLYITKAYFESFLKEMGKDHYVLLKSAIQKLGRNFLGKGAPRVSIIHTKGKIDPEGTQYSLAFSLVAEVKANLRVKLLFELNLSEGDYAYSLQEFLNWLEHLQTGSSSLAELKGISDTQTISGTVLMVFNKEEKRLEVIDPLRKHRKDA